MRVTVLCSNDYPHSVYADEAAADAEAARLNAIEEAAEKARWAPGGSKELSRSRVFYHTHVVPMIYAEGAEK